MVDPVLDKVGKLIRLALHNPNVEEARSAALKALQLMDQHGMVVTMREQLRPAPPPPIQPVRGPSDDALRQARERTAEYLRQQQAAQHRGGAREPARYHYDAQRDCYFDTLTGSFVHGKDFDAAGKPRPDVGPQQTAPPPASGSFDVEGDARDLRARAFKEFYERAKARGDVRASTGFFDWLKGT